MHAHVPDPCMCTACTQAHEAEHPMRVYTRASSHVYGMRIACIQVRSMAWLYPGGRAGYSDAALLCGYSPPRSRIELASVRAGGRIPVNGRVFNQ